MNWYYVDGGQQAGPVDDAQLAGLVRDGKVQPDTLVWREGLADWQPYQEAKVPGLRLAPSSTAPAATGAPASAEAVCAECGRIFNADDMIRHEELYVCANCKPVFMQKLAEGVRFEAGAMRYAGFWIRFAAKFLDGLILAVPLIILFFLLFSSTSSRAAGVTGGAGGPTPMEFSFFPMFFQLGFIFIRMAYEVFFLGKYGATPGKMACGLRAVTADGGRFGYGRATGRFFAELLSGMLCYIGYVIVAFDRQKRALHDHICGTRVVYK